MVEALEIIEEKYVISRLLVYLKIFYEFIIIRSCLAEKQDGRSFRNY
jgi:hypothetical protein